MTSPASAAAVTTSAAVPVRRLVWCSAGGRVLHGRTRPAPPREPGFLQRLLGISPHGGTIFEFDPVELDAAQAALAAHLNTPGVFAIETAEGARLDFFAAPRAETVRIDCWFFDLCHELDAVVVGRGAARELLGGVYALQHDAEVAGCLRELARRPAAA